jgi:hypothetical protein
MTRGKDEKKLLATLIIFLDTLTSTFWAASNVCEARAISLILLYSPVRHAAASSGEAYNSPLRHTL